MQLSTVTVRLTNAAPANLPAFVTHRDRLTRQNPLGSERVFVALYATTGAQVLGVRGDGGQLLVHAGSEAGHPRFETDVTIDRGATATLVFRLIEPKSAQPVVVWRQPGVTPETVEVAGRRCD
jgi:hypothetical protein